MVLVTGTELSRLWADRGDHLRQDGVATWRRLRCGRNWTDCYAHAPKTSPPARLGGRTAWLRRRYLVSPACALELHRMTKLLVLGGTPPRATPRAHGRPRGPKVLAKPGSSCAGRDNAARHRPGLMPTGCCRAFSVNHSCRHPGQGRTLRMGPGRPARPPICCSPAQAGWLPEPMPGCGVVDDVRSGVYLGHRARAGRGRATRAAPVARSTVDAGSTGGWRSVMARRKAGVHRWRRAPAAGEAPPLLERRLAACCSLASLARSCRRTLA